MLLVFVLVVLLNLLVAIIDDSFEKIMSNVDCYYGHNLTMICLDYENLIKIGQKICCRPDNKQESHLLFAECQYKEEDRDEWEGRINSINQ